MGRADRAVSAHIPQQVERGRQCHRGARRRSGGGGDIDAVMAMPRVESSRIEWEGEKGASEQNVQCSAVLCCGVLCCPAPSPLPPRTRSVARSSPQPLPCSVAGWTWTWLLVG